MSGPETKPDVIWPARYAGDRRYWSVEPLRREEELGPYLRKDGLPREMADLLSEVAREMPEEFTSAFENKIISVLSRWAALDQDKEGGA